MCTSVSGVSLVGVYGAVSFVEFEGHVYGSHVVSCMSDVSGVDVSSAEVALTVLGREVTYDWSVCVIVGLGSDRHGIRLFVVGV